MPVTTVVSTETLTQQTAVVRRKGQLKGEQDLPMMIKRIIFSIALYLLETVS